MFPNPARLNIFGKPIVLPRLKLLTIVNFIESVTKSSRTSLGHKVDFLEGSPPIIMDVDAITVEVITKTLRAWRQGQNPPPDLLNLDLLLDPASGPVEGRDLRLRELILKMTTEELDRARRIEDVMTPSIPPTREVLRGGIARDFAGGKSELQAWSALYHRYLAPLEFSVDELAKAVSMDPRHFRRLVDAGERRLTEHLRRAEMAAHARSRANHLRRHLPPPEYARLFGVDEPLAKIVDLLRRLDGPLLISIEGLGGIGKTALARAVAHQLADGDDFDGIAWISARQSWLSDAGAIEQINITSTSLADIISQLAEQLGLTNLVGLGTDEKLARIAEFTANSRCLIVVDNLETVSDIDTLLPALTTLAGPARVLLTSRQAMSSYPLVHRRAIKPLSLTDSHALVESELERRGLDHHLDLADMQDLFDVVGGMPLALKLVTAQMSRWPLTALLSDMRQIRSRAPQSLYTFIYRRAWLELSDSARAMLLSLLHISPEGEDLEWLQLVTLLPTDEFNSALDQLLAYSLLDAAGSAAIPRYRLHRLTITFLQTEILSQWDNGQQISKRIYKE